MNWRRSPYGRNRFVILRCCRSLLSSSKETGWPKIELQSLYFSLLQYLPRNLSYWYLSRITSSGKKWPRKEIRVIARKGSKGGLLECPSTPGNGGAKKRKHFRLDKMLEPTGNGCRAFAQVPSNLLHTFSSIPSSLAPSLTLFLHHLNNSRLLTREMVFCVSQFRIVDEGDNQSVGDETGEEGSVAPFFHEGSPQLSSLASSAKAWIGSNNKWSESLLLSNAFPYSLPAGIPYIQYSLFPSCKPSDKPEWAILLITHIDVSIIFMKSRRKQLHVHHETHWQ